MKGIPPMNWKRPTIAAALAGGLVLAGVTFAVHGYSIEAAVQ